MSKQSNLSLKTKMLCTTGLAAFLLVGGILPAEFGIDPTGIGAKTGLVALASNATTPQPFDSVMEFNIEEYDISSERIERSIKGLVTLQDAPFQTETITIELEDLGEVEHKFVMQEGMSFVYSWDVKNVKGDGVYFDFHGHPKAADVDAFPDGFEMAYSKSEGDKQSGAFRAPFDGLHGFYFLNLEEGPITIELNVVGYFDDSQEVYRAVDGKIIKQLDL